jgi:hypothetical protein
LLLRARVTVGLAWRCSSTPSLISKGELTLWVADDDDVVVAHPQLLPRPSGGTGQVRVAHASRRRHRMLKLTVRTRTHALRQHQPSLWIEQAAELGVAEVLPRVVVAAAVAGGSDSVPVEPNGMIIGTRNSISAGDFVAAAPQFPFLCAHASSTARVRAARRKGQAGQHQERPKYQSACCCWTLRTPHCDGCDGRGESVASA